MSKEERGVRVGRFRPKPTTFAKPVLIELAVDIHMDKDKLKQLIESLSNVKVVRMYVPVYPSAD
jgi:hypothetical protein